MPTPLEIPTVTDGAHFYTIRCRLDGSTYNFTFHWNARQELWYLSIADSENVAIASSIGVVCGLNLLRYLHYDPRTPPGDLVAFDLTDDDAPPGLLELGESGRVKLLYYPIEEIA
jgi:hypothetical protein